MKTFAAGGLLAATHRLAAPAYAQGMARHCGGTALLTGLAGGVVYVQTAPISPDAAP
ncbi:hypothetical protein PV773_14330 [Mesorhizobium sp. CC13]|uniref:hypothetical protein n=1 Tax=Mesorhizobium sp. CC13 TaxID=3029194 RepID=UPI0032658A08